jgi:hypothetical protein
LLVCNDQRLGFILFKVALVCESVLPMSNNNPFIPRQKRAATKYGANMYRVLSAANGSEMGGLTTAEVAELGDSVAANRAALADVDSLTNALMAATKRLSGPKGTHRRMLGNIRSAAKKIRLSDVSNAQLAKLRLKRVKSGRSRRNAPKEAPEFNVGHGIPGVINIRFRELGSASPRARAANAIGAHIAVVDAARPATRGEADKAFIKMVSSSPAKLDTTGWPAKVRLYACWVTRRGETSPWTDAKAVTVM